MTQASTVSTASTASGKAPAVQQSRGSGGGATAGAAPSRKVQMVAGATSFAEGEALLSPQANVQMEAKPGASPAVGNQPAPAAAEGQAGGEADKGAEAKDGDKPAAKEDPFADERAQLDAAGKAALAALPETSAADANKTPGNVGQGDVGGSSELPEWFTDIQGRLVASTTWGEAEEAAQHAIRDYAMLIARSHAGPDGKVPGHIKAFFEYIGRGTKNDTAAKKGGHKGSSDLNGASGAKNWCAGAATQAQNIAKKEGRAAVIEDLKARGLELNTAPSVFFDNLAQLSGSTKAKQFYGGDAYAEPLEPGDRVDYLFDGCQYGGHAVHVVADLGDAFLHVSGNTTRHSAVATGQASRIKAKPEGLNLNTACSISSDEAKKKASEHISHVKFGGAKLVYSITRHSSPYKALEMLATDDPAAFDVALKKLCLKKGKPTEAPKAPGAGS